MSESRAGAVALDERYGRRGLRRGPWATVIAAVALVLIAIVWFLWARPIDPTNSIEVTDLHFEVPSTSSATTTWRLVVEPGRETTCAINALNDAHAVVGWRIVDVPASAQAVRDITETLRTAERAADVFVYRCWLT